MSDRSGRALAGMALVAILALAAWLRVQGLAFGLPAVYNPDEIAIMSRALAFAKGDLNPHNFLYPTFYFYVLFALDRRVFRRRLGARRRALDCRVPVAVLRRSLGRSTSPAARLASSAAWRPSRRFTRWADGLPARRPGSSRRSSSRWRRPPSATRTT